MYTDPGHPTLVRSGIVTSSSITVRWQAVSCLDRNGDVTSYRAQAVRNGMIEETAKVGGGAGQAKISGLSPSMYTVQVAAMNGAGSVHTAVVYLSGPVVSLGRTK